MVNRNSLTTLSESVQADHIIQEYVDNLFDPNKIQNDVFDIINNDTINKYIKNLHTHITGKEGIQITSNIISSLITDLTTIKTDIDNSISAYNTNIKLLDSYFDNSAGSIGRYNDSLEIYNFKLLENILYSIGIIILIYKMIGWNININL